MTFRIRKSRAFGHWVLTLPCGKGTVSSDSHSELVTVARLLTSAMGNLAKEVR